MSIQHAVIPDAFLHEPKGVATASTGEAYVANGSGSGTWKRIDSTDLQGVTGDGGSDNLELLSDGSNGFQFKVRAVFGSMVITNNATNFPVTAAVDPTLATNTDYVLLTGVGAPWAAGGTEFGGIVIGVDRITVPVTGIYKVDLWSTISGYPNVAAKIAVKHRVNGGAFSSRFPISKSNSAGDAGQLGGFGLVQLTANDFIQLYVASTHTGNLVLQHANTTLQLLRAT